MSAIIRRVVTTVRWPAWLVALVLTAMVVPTLPAQNRANRAAAVTTRPTSAVESAYQRRFDRLAPDDVDGHHALAAWCHQRKQYGLLLWQAEYVLQLDALHPNARLLRTIALYQMELSADGGSDGAGVARGMPANRPSIESLFITDEDVQALRFAELQEWLYNTRLLDPKLRERVKVKFHGGVRTDFLDEVAGDPDLGGTANRQAFLRLDDTEQLQLIQQHSGNRHAPFIEITSDPVTFREFKRVLPLIERGCATTGCHGGDEPARPFGLRTSHLYPERSLYTNFIILDRTRAGQNWVVNRDRPELSLLLEYGLPDEYTENPHPTYIDPLYPRGTGDSKYQKVLDWLKLLRVPRPPTGVVLDGYPEPPPPGEELFRQLQRQKGQAEPVDEGAN